VDNPTCSWSPRPALVGVCWLLALGCLSAAVVAGVSADRPGALFFGVGAVVLGLLAAYGTLLRPKLAADGGGLCVRTLTGTHRFTWDEVRLRLVTTRRLARQTTTIELEAADDTLVVLGWLELGADPQDVLDELDALRAR
jgi:hypothetical protein